MGVFAGLPSEPKACALELARRGLPVFPCGADKRPVVKHGFKDATTDPIKINAWWSGRPAALIGVPTGPTTGLMVHDWDAKSCDVEHALAEMEADFGPINGPLVRTMSGGIHVWTRWADGIRNSASRLRPGYDVRGEGGYAIAPGSRGYVLQRDAEPGEPPETLINALRTLSGGPRLSVVGGTQATGLTPHYQRTMEENIRAAMTEGSRHEAVLKIVWSFVQRGFSLEEIMLLAPVIGAANGWGAHEAAREMYKMAEGAFKKQGKPIEGEPVLSAADPLPISPYDHASLGGIPARQWVYGPFLIRRYLTVLGAPGGVGKTALAVTIALAIAAGRSLIGQTVHERGKVLLVNLEDDLDEIRRRVGAAMILHGVSQDEINDRLFIMSGRDSQLVIAERTKEGGLIATPNVERLLREIKARGVTTLICDPFVKSHRLEENRNEQVDFAATQWTRIAHESGCATLLLHHFRKGGMSGEADAFRGASALIDAARSAISLAPMSDKERGDFNIDAEIARRLVRMDNAKANLAVKPERAEWFELASVTLPNGDSVQAVRKWEAPGLFKGVSANLADRMLDAIAMHFSPGVLYSRIRRAGERWAGWAVINTAARDDIEISEELAARMIDQWLKSGALEEVEFWNADTRTKAKGVQVNDDKRPGREPKGDA